MNPVEKPEAPALPVPSAPPKDLIAAAIEAIAKDAKTQPVEYVKATIIPGGGE